MTTPSDDIAALADTGRAFIGLTDQDLFPKTIDELACLLIDYLGPDKAKLLARRIGEIIDGRHQRAITRARRQVQEAQAEQAEAEAAE